MQSKLLGNGIGRTFNHAARMIVKHIPRQRDVKRGNKLMTGIPYGRSHAVPVVELTTVMFGTPCFHRPLFHKTDADGVAARRSFQRNAARLNVGYGIALLFVAQTGKNDAVRVGDGNEARRGTYGTVESLHEAPGNVNDESILLQHLVQFPRLKSAPAGLVGIHVQQTAPLP